MLSRWFNASRRLAGASTKYILAVESEHGFEPANFLDASAKETLENRPGIFAKSKRTMIIFLKFFCGSFFSSIYLSFQLKL